LTVPAAGIQITGDLIRIHEEVGGGVVAFNDLFGTQWSVDRDGVQTVVTESVLKITGKNVRINSNLVPDKVLLRPNTSGAVDVIGVMDIEKYLNGVLPHEMPPSWPKEALKAQAIAARSYAVSQMKLRRN